MTGDRIYDDAAQWLVREQGESMDWDGFAGWLDADPRHRAAYDQLALIDRDIDEHSAYLSTLGPSQDLVAADDRRPLPWVRFGAGAGAVAAGLAVILLLQPTRPALPVQDYRAPAGKSLDIPLASGRAVLAPASHLRVQGQHIALEGTGYFDIQHRQGRTLVVSAGAFQVTDVGTRFSVENDPQGFSVEVAQGSVSVSSAGLAAPLTVSAGHGLAADRSSETVHMLSIDPQAVGSWRNGTLQFDRVPLALVAREISRYSGTEVTVDPTIAEQPFSGVIATNHGEAPARTLAEILSLQLKSVDGGYRLEPRRK